MKLEDIHIGVSPLTDRIYLGTVSKKEAGVWNQKVDCTSKFLTAFMDWIGVGGIREIKDSHGNRYEIEVRKVAVIAAHKEKQAND